MTNEVANALFFSINQQTLILVVRLSIKQYPKAINRGGFRLNFSSK